MNMERTPLIKQLLRFSLVGAGVFIVQAGLVEGAARWIGPARAQLLAFPFAVTLAWQCNRRFTFAPSTHSVWHEWLRYVLANGVGWAISNLIYFALIFSFPIIHRYPAIAVAAGTAGGLVFNFSASRYLVFEK